MEMKQMPYRVEEGAIERAKYRAKMAIREAAHPTERPSHKVQWRWASAVAMVAVIAVGVFAFVKVLDLKDRELSTMDKLVAEMKSAPDDIIADLSVDVGYYLDEEDNSL